jgi:hypothetical protein
MADLIRYPTGVQYREALYNTGLAFQDSALRGGEPEPDPLGMPKAISGNFASVFTINGTDGRRWAVKCFTRHVRDQSLRYQNVSRVLNEIRSPWKVDFEYLPDGVLCEGARYPVLKMEWVEATGLIPYVEAHLTDSGALADLAGRFGDLVADLSRHVRSSNGSVSAYLVRRDGRQVSPRGIGEKKAQALNSWRLGVESAARANQPTVLPPAQQSAIANKYAQRRRSLENDKQVSRRQTVEQRETWRKNWAAKHTEFEQELNDVTARFAQLRAEKETGIAPRPARTQRPPSGDATSRSEN